MELMKTEIPHELRLSIAASLAVCLPTFVLSVWLMEAKIAWSHPSLIVVAILALAALNFGAIVVLEYYRSSIGSLTLPALIGTVSLVLMYMIAEGINRFFRDFGYDWLFPAVVLVLGLSLLAIFKEKQLLLKLQLAANSLAIAVLGALGAADKVAMPF